MLSRAAVEMVRETMFLAAPGERATEAGRLAAQFGVSVATVYRHATPPRERQRRTRKPARPEYRDWTRIAVRYQWLAPKPIPMDLAIRGAVEAGALPREALDMPVATANRVRRELGLARRPKRHARLFADYPMQAVLFDGSTSEFLTVLRPEGDDWLLRFHRKPYSAGGYKNKPLAAHRLRLVAYGLWDMCTGYTRSQYRIAKGENALDSVDALWAMCQETGDPDRPLHGVPDNLWTDQGALFKAHHSRHFVDRLGIALDAGGRPDPDKTRQGGVERPWRTQWERFERSLFMLRRDEILLSEVAERLVQYEREQNGAPRKARVDVDGHRLSRAAAWTELTRRRPAGNPLRRMPADAMDTVACEKRVWINAGGIVRWLGAEYEVAGWQSMWAVAWRPAADNAPDEIVLQDEDTGQRRPAARLKPRPYGEIRAAPKTALDELRGESPDDLPAGDVFAPKPSAPASNVVRMGVRTAPPAPLDNPLDADAMRGLEEAMGLFLELYPHRMSADDRAAVVARIEAAGLSRRAVVALAHDLVALARSA